MFNLDSILDSTAARMARPVVVSENHDTRSINWVNGLSDPGELISCGYLPNIRRRSGERDAEYADRIRPVVMALPQHQRDKIMNAAVRRASLDTSNGRVAVMVAGEPAWHRLGINVQSAVSAADAIQLAGLNWPVELRRLSYGKDDGSRGESDKFAIVRADTEAFLGAVGNRYRPIQNAEGFGFLDAVLAEHGARYHTAGAVFGGEKVWMQCALPNQSFEVVAGDKVDCYATFSNPHDGSGKAYCYPTTNRIVCANTLRVASADARDGIGIRHTGDIRAKVGDAQRALGCSVKAFDQFRDSAEVMVRTPLEPVGFFNGLLDSILDITQAEMSKGADFLAGVIARNAAERELESKRIQRQIDARKNTLDDIIGRYESARNGISGIRGSAWAALNAVTDHTSHSKPSRRVGTNEEQLSRRFESVLGGDGDRLNQLAYETIMQTVSA